MAVLYWVHLPEHTDFLREGYIGVTENAVKRFRSHKHKFKSISQSIVSEILLIADKSYCYLIEQKLRPNRNIGWNKSPGGYRNNVMIGADNPNYGCHGQNAPNFKGLWITPLGKFETSNEAAAAHNLQQSAIIRKCKGRYANNKFYPPKNGWAFEPKERVKP
jgi:hypothetical protein